MNWHVPDWDPGRNPSSETPNPKARIDQGLGFRNCGLTPPNTRIPLRAPVRYPRSSETPNSGFGFRVGSAQGPPLGDRQLACAFLMYNENDHGWSWRPRHGPLWPSKNRRKPRQTIALKRPTRHALGFQLVRRRQMHGPCRVHMPRVEKGTKALALETLSAP